MNRPAPLLRHARAGRLDAARIAARWSDADGAHAAQAPLVPGAVRVGPFELEVVFDVAGGFACVDAVARNAASRPVRLDAIVAGFRWSEHGVTDLRQLRNGWQSWSFTAGLPVDDAGTPRFPSGPWLRGMFHALGEPPADRAGWHESHLLTALGASPAGATCVAGALETGRGFGVTFARRDGDDVLVEVESWLERPLAPGERCAAERVRVSLGDEAPSLLEEHAEANGRLAGARVTSPFQAGWCSWYHFFHGVTEADLLRNLEALVAQRAEIPVGVVQLDDGYQRAIGDWLETNPKFPSGLAKLAREIRSAGFTAGLWTAPFCVAPESRIHDAHRGWLLRQGDALFRGLHHGMWTRDGWIFVLDASRPEVIAHLRSTFATLVEMGFTYQKLDFLYTEAMQADAFDPGVSRAARLRRGLEAVRAGCGDAAFLLGCGCPLGPAIGLVDGMRIGPDVAPSWGTEAPVVVPGLEQTSPSTRSGVRSILARAFMHRRLWLNDPDCLMSRTTDTKLAPDEARTLAVATAATGGMVLFSDDVPKLAPESRTLVRDTIAVAREVDAAAPRGTARTLDPMGSEIAPGVVARTASGALIALVNAGDETAERTLDLDALGIPADASIRELALGSARRAEATRGGVRVELAPHASALLRVRTGPALTVFCDFDGTFAVQDVGSTLARRYAADRRPALWARLERGELSAWEYNLELLDRLAVPEDELEAFLRTVELDPGARPLVEFCAARGIPFRVLSDGFDRNLDRLQELSGVRFEYDANRLWYEEGRWRIAAVQPDPSCHCGTGNCKARRIAVYREANPGVRVVHVGNGRVSDLCGAEAADVAFAKGSLATAMRERGSPFEPFETLLDVVAGLERILGGE